MALKGNLQDFSITQLLNLINVAQKTGTLVVERSPDQVFISFREGKLSYARDGSVGVGLTMVLYRARKLNAAQVRAINERAGTMSDQELDCSDQFNYLTNKKSPRAYKHIISICCIASFLGKGLFHFDNDLLPPRIKSQSHQSREHHY
jgi:hypothetical protein